MPGRVHEVTVENFKSYEGRVRIGPFKKFTCIVGPNGAGKSNLMEAISFVLGVQSRHLRGDRQQDLVHRKEGEADATVAARAVSAELTYVDTEDGSNTVFRRVLQPSSEARFQVNGEAISKEGYMGRLEAIHILSEARNFLVFQGDVEAAANKKGKDLSTFFEQVSGSIHLRQEYEELAAEKARKEDKARYLFTRRRNAVNERKRVTHQKDEAERYQTAEEERRRLQVEFYLFRLHCLEWQREEACRAGAGVEREEREMQARVQGCLQQLEACERERAQAHLAKTQAERAAEAAVGRKQRAAPEAVEVCSRLDTMQTRLEDLREHAEKEEKRQSQLAEQATELRKVHARVEEEMKVLSERVQQAQLPFTPEQRREFEEAQQAAEQQTSSSNARVRELDGQLRTVIAERARVEREAWEAGNRCDHLRRRVQELSEGEGEFRSKQERYAELARAKIAQLERLQSSGSDNSEETRRLHGERQQILNQIQDITATERQLESERRLARITGDLQQLVPQVRGRVLELCRPSQKRMRVAVNVALGGYLDAVVIDTADAARHCMRHLKERMLGTMTFLPLDSLRAPAPDRRLQEALRDQTTLRPALSCIAYEEQFAQCFEFLLGDVVIADNMAEGRRFVFGEMRARGISCRLVTLDGETISRDGNLAVSSDAAREGATRFDFAALEGQRGRLEAIDRRLYELHSLASSGEEGRATMQEEVRRFEQRAQEQVQGLERCQGELVARRAELEAAEAAAHALRPEAERLATEEPRLREAQRQLEESIGQVVSGHFVQLSAAMGVDDIRKHEREWRRAREAAQLRAGEKSQQLDSLRLELQMLEQTLRERAQRNPQEAVAACEAEIAGLQVRKEQLLDSSKTVREEEESVKARLSEQLEAERRCEKAVARYRQELREQQQELASAVKRGRHFASELRALRDAKGDLLRQSVLEDVEVPLLQGGQEALQDAAVPLCDAGAAAPDAGGDEAMAEPVAAADVAVDLSSLPEEKRAVASGPVVKLLEEEYRNELCRLEGELERLRPNLKAIGQLANATGEADEAAQEAAAARRDYEEVGSRFEAVRKARRERFMECFRKVQDEISTVYKRLTAGCAGRGCEGGSAYLDLEDLEDPFNGGVKFTAMPPSKRFCDISLLSGGEKTLAAMALLFAMQAYRRPPFLVLDEVDASLDAGNVQALARYVEQSECQTIVISLKDKLFNRSEGLVGVSKNKRTESSVILTVDLARIRAQHAPGSKLVPLPAPAQSAGVHVAAPPGEAEDVEMAE